MMNNKHITNFENLTEVLIESKRQNVLPQDCYPVIQQWYKSQTGSDEKGRLEKLALSVEGNTELTDRLEQKEEGLSEYFCRAIKDYDLNERLLRLRQI